MKYYRALRASRQEMRGRVVWTQLVFWLLSLVVLYRLFTADYNGGVSDVIYTLLFHIPILMVVYGNWWLHDKFSGQSFWIFTLGFVLLAIFGIALHFLVFEVGSDYLAPGFYFISYYSAFQIFQFIASYLVISTLLIWSLNWFDLQNKQAAILRENQEVKLRSLKAQVNPHFLINSLNNIYSLASDKHEETRNYLVKLSDALRYMVYETESDKVLLENELQYLRDYIALEELRLEEGANIKLLESGRFQGYVIAPLLLVPLVENCFKHCDREQPEIKISFIETKKGLTLKTLNNYRPVKSDMPNGVGLVNVRKRLELIYPNKYELIIDDGQEFYTMELKLDLS